MASVERILNYTFNDQGLLKQALQHRSFGGGHYERLEFLGDRVLNLCVAEMVFHRYTKDAEGKLSQRVAALVREETLADVCTELGLAEFIVMAESEEQTGGREKPSILADIVESLLGAMYVDAGTLEPARQFIRTHWEKRIDTVMLLDAKSHLQEHLQAQKLDLPSYQTVESLGEDHNKTFIVQVTSSLGAAQGEGHSKQAAGQAAAESLLKKLGEREENA